MQVVKRNGEIVEFDHTRIFNAITKAFAAIDAKLSEEQVKAITDEVITEVNDRFVEFYPNVENIQDIVEKRLMHNEHYEVAKAYILYRAKRTKKREKKKEQIVQQILTGKMVIIKRKGQKVLLNVKKIQETFKRVAQGYEKIVDPMALDSLTKEVVKNLYDSANTQDIADALVLAAVSFIERDPAYSYIAARLLLQKTYKEVVGNSIKDEDLPTIYKETFKKNIAVAVQRERAHKDLLSFDLDKLAEALDPDRDRLFQYMGIRYIYDKYMLRDDDNNLLELPQTYWMRIAMGLALLEENKEEKAIEFYQLLSSLRYISSTPTQLFAGTPLSQLSSCFLSTVQDDLHDIFKNYADTAQLLKWCGGVAVDWGAIRSTGGHIKSTNVKSQGLVPFLKIFNDVVVSINRSGRRRGAACVYIEPWHLDYEDFLELRKNTGDERRRAHDTNTASWIPDLFMKRVMSDGEWTLFSPGETPDLHDLYGKAFEKRYEEYEKLAQRGEIKLHKVVSAKKLWRKMLSMLFETGHPWITFKDTANIRSPQDHMGVVHSSNLCTEITLNTSKEETAVCNLGSVNLSRHVIDGKIDYDELAKSVEIAIRMLDNVIDLNFYPIDEAKNSNLKHRPIGLGVMGTQDLFFKMDIPFDSDKATELTDKIMEFVSYHAILSSSKLAKEKGAYPSYKGSKWDRNIFPVDTLKLLEEERCVPVEIKGEERLNWAVVREHVKQHGMRNSNTMAIAPTASIANIAGCYPSIEPIYKNIYVKANIVGEFTVVNSYLVEDLKKLGLWGKDMLDQLKYYDGNLEYVPGIPEHLKQKYKEAFEIDPVCFTKQAAARGKWIDQSQSLNIFMRGTSGKKLDEIYFSAWKMGLKTTYYLRTLGASQIEKSTLDAKKFGFTQKREYKQEEKPKEVATASTPQDAIKQKIEEEKKVKACLLNDPSCESCQ